MSLYDDGYDYSVEDNFDYTKAGTPYEYGQLEAESALNMDY